MDAYLGLGYVHAQDRLWQMLIARRRAQGRMAALFGAEMLDADRRARHLGFAYLAESDLDALGEAERQRLTAYADGINAYLTTLIENSRGRGAPEFYFYPTEVALWRPADSLRLR